MMQISVRREVIARDVYVIAEGRYADNETTYAAQGVVTYQQLDAAKFKGALLFDVEKRVVFQLMTEMQQATTE